MEATIEILKLLIPSLFVFLTAWIVLRAFLNRETDVVQGLLARDAENRRVDLLKTTNETLLPMRLQAYERMTLFCSRMEIGQLVTNTKVAPGMTAEMYKMALTLQVEEELHHNITQQVYMTDDLWNIILLAKKEVTQICQKLYNDLVNEYEKKGLEGEPSAKNFLDAMVAYLQQNPQIGYIQALGAIKKEVGVLFN